MKSSVCRLFSFLAKRAYSSVAILFIALTFLTPANAGFISASNTNLQYASGRYANLQGLQWLTLDETKHKSRLAVERSSLMENDGWRFATRAETATLLGSLWGGSMVGLSASNYDGAAWFLNTLGGLASNQGPILTNHLHSYFFFGDDGECSSNTNKSCVGNVTNFDNRSKDALGYDAISSSLVSSYTADSGRAGFFSEKLGLDAGLDSGNKSTRKNIAKESWASLLVRDETSTAVPEPAPITLMAIGLLLGYFSVGRKRV